MFIRQNNLVIINASTEDATILGKWWRDGEVMAHAGFPNGISITDEAIAEQLAADTDDIHRRLMVEVEGLAIGEMNYRNKGNGTAQIGIKICDVSKQEKGYGTTLLKMLISSLFEDMGYTKIILDTNLNNLRAQHVYEKLGFRKVTVNYNSWENQLGELQSSVDYELTKDEYLFKLRDHSFA
jgi:RimJ/RimL family protein N-acetyltransferase